MNDLEQWLDDNTEVPGETAVKVIDIGHLVLMGAEMFSEAAGVGLAGGTLGPVAMFVGMAYELFYGADAAAMADVKKRDFLMGYGLGVASGAIGEKAAFVARKFQMRSASGGGTTIQKQIAVAGANAWNTGLAMGFKHASNLSPAKRKKLVTLLTTRMLSDIKARGGKYYDTNDEDFIWGLAAAFVKMSTK